MTDRQKSEAVAAAVLLAFGAVFLAQTSDFPSFPGDPGGPALLPVITATCVIFLSIYILARLFVRRAAAGPGSPTAAAGQPSRVTERAGLLVLLLIYPALVVWLGFATGTTAYCAASFWTMTQRSATALLYGVVVAALLFVMFRILFEVSLPLGYVDALFLG